MLDSGDTVQPDHARFAAGTAALDERVAEMAARRRHVGDAVEHLLRGRRGEAADTFLASWEAWRDGADAVIDDLRRDVASLGAPRSDLRLADSTASDAAGLLQGRLG